jgi:hypothetical protein
LLLGGVTEVGLARGAVGEGLVWAQRVLGLPEQARLSPSVMIAR